MSDEIRLDRPQGHPAAAPGGSGRIQVPRQTLIEIDEHVGGDTTVEQGGVLVGRYHEPTRTTMITSHIPAVDAIADVASLRFTHETWDHANAVLEREHPGRQMVGWYHSHPHFGIFLSNYDQFIHENFFREAWQVAYVVDPLLGQRGFFAWVDGVLCRVPSWVTWLTEYADGEGPIGSPPVRSPGTARDPRDEGGSPASQSEADAE